MSKCRLLKPMYKIANRTDGTPNQRLALVIVIAIIGISVALVTPGLSGLHRQGSGQSGVQSHGQPRYQHTQLAYSNWRG